MHTKHTILLTQVYQWDFCSLLCSSTCDFWSSASPTQPMCYEKHHSTIPFVFTGRTSFWRDNVLFCLTILFFALSSSSEMAAWSFFVLYRSKSNRFKPRGWAERTGTLAMQGVHCAPGPNIWFVCTGTWKDNKIKMEITLKRLFCGFVSSKPEGRKTVIGTYVQNVIEYWTQNQHFFQEKSPISKCFLFLPACSSGCLLSKISIFAATVNVAISKISSVTNITTLVPYLVRILGGPLPRCSNNLFLMPTLKWILVLSSIL